MFNIFAQCCFFFENIFCFGSSTIENENNQKKNPNFTVWTTNFPNLFKLTDRGKQLNPNAMVAYKRPQFY